MNSLAVDYPMGLWALLGCFLPWFRYWLAVQRHPYLQLQPRAKSARYIDRWVRLLGSAAVCALVLGISGLHIPQSSVPKVGTGAHVVIALDRSRSMDQAFADGLVRMRNAERLRAPSKGAVARDVMRDFIRSRNNDMFAFLVFSTHAIPVMPLTQKHDALYASIAAGGIGRGLGDTDIGEGLLTALSLFEGQAFSGSRIILLVSDGAAHLDVETRRQIWELVQQHRVALYWLYIRTANGPDIFSEQNSEDPEVRLHRFFSRLPTTYRGYSAERPSDLAQAVADISQLQNLPLNTREQIAKRELSKQCFSVALICLILLASIEWMMVRTPAAKQKPV